MKKSDLFRELLDTYRRHGWELKSVLLTPATMAEIEAGTVAVDIKEATIDALWFSRPSRQNREAWELRLLAEMPYALFETFESDETEDQRAGARKEMEARLLEFVSTK
jgi:hypothetical protein